MPETRNTAEERARTLYIRLPHTIRDADEIRDLFAGDIIVRMTRQSSRSCHVVFPDPEEKLKAMKSVRSKKINGKRVVAFNPKPKPVEKKINRKKIVIPKPAPQPKITRLLFVSNIKNGTTIEELKEAFPGCVSVFMLGLNKKNIGSAFIKMESLEMSARLLRKAHEWPTVRNNKLFIKADTRKAKKPSASLKIWDGEHEVPVETNQMAIKQKNEDSEDEDDESDEEESESDAQVTESEEE